MKENNMKLNQDISEVEPVSMLDLSFSEDFPSDSTPAEFSSIPNLCLPDTDCLFKESCTSPESSLLNQCDWFPEETPQSVSSTQKAKKTSRSKAIRKNEMDKKAALKQMRNRVSAQRSRDRKKKEMEDLMTEAEKLRSENLDLASQLQAAKQELELLRQMTSKVKKPKSKGKKKGNMKCKFLLAALLLGCFCMTSCISSLPKTMEIPEGFKKLTMESVRAVTSPLIEGYQLTASKKERPKYVGEQIHLDPKPDSEIPPPELQESTEGDLRLDLIGYNDIQDYTDKTYIKGPEIYCAK